ncbi:ochratoxin A non-ribosomal peptide synthetase [Clathrospora elynae]|uniref:Ochratoxin A non-ribosomal peptide synthetase n=1 Tax=Clathrospora elynae TaxID=706981 RepID=A0A6A5SUC7_9PLEO|nr:ochratoxin A non-ribosomal peptide synthetase [Clathrospora elynae]
MSLPRGSSILLPNIVKQNAQADPHGTFARVPAGTAYTDGFVDVTKLQLHNAVNFTASLIKRCLGDSTTFETLAFIGPSDLRYSIIIVAAIKAGYKIFLPSPRNSEEAQLALLAGLQCTKFVVTEPQSPCVPVILRKVQLHTMTLPSLQELLEVGDVAEYPYEKAFAEAKDDPIIVLHTSGSTGIPKPLPWTNDHILRQMNAHTLPAPEGYVGMNRYSLSGRFMTTMPPFHAAGLLALLQSPLYLGPVPVYLDPGSPPTTEAILSAIMNTEVDWAFVAPSIINDLSKNPDLLEAVASRLQYIFFGGGSVPKITGDVVAQRLPIYQIFGLSEAGIIPLVHAQSNYDNAKDWNYIQVNPSLKIEMRHRHEDLHEFVLVRNEEMEACQPVFSLFPAAHEFSTRDLFSPHPTTEGLWVYHSRLDDVIVFLNGEKTNPITFEEEVVGHKEVKAALVVGAQRFEAALLVELATQVELSDEEQAAIIDRIWPVVERANRVTPAHARIAKSKILLVDPSVPMLRTGKGTLQRNATLNLYATKIEKLYQQDEVLDTVHAEFEVENDIKSMVRNIVAEMLDLDDLDFFQLGMDSLGALRMQRALKKQFPGKNIPNNIAYSNSSVNAVVNALEKPDVPTNEQARKDGDDSTDELARMIEAYSRKIDDIGLATQWERPAVDDKPKTVVLLTGTTGSLGSYILQRLLSTKDVAHIYCFNRTTDARERQIRNSKNRNLDTHFPPERVTFLDGDLAKPSFGLPETGYQTLVSEVTHVIHNAWPVNFNLQLDSFRPSLSGVISLIQFSAQSRWHGTIQFISSISSVANYPSTTVPEAVIHELSSPSPMGYGQSKYLAEQLLDYACKNLGISASFVRLGQIAGAARTASGWNRQEWLPSLVASSAFIRALPKTLGRVSAAGVPIDCNWVPVDHLAEVLVELTLAPEDKDKSGKRGVSVNQIVHPKPVSWSSLLQPIQKAIEDSVPLSTPIEIVTYPDWLSILKSRTAEAESDTNVDHAMLVQRNPAIKLLGFYEDSSDKLLKLTLSIENTMKASKTLRDLEPLRDEWVTGWVKEWVSISV